MSPGVGVEAALAAQTLDEGTIDDGEVEPELLQHLVAPLDLQRRWADDKNAVCLVAEHQLQNDHPGLDGFSEPHIVGDEQVDAGHLDRTDDGVELIALDFDAASEGRLKLARIGDRPSAPAYGVKEGFEVGGLIEAFGLGQLHLLEG